MERGKQNKLYGFCIKVLFPVLLALYPLRHIIYGVEWWDTGYNYANFTYMDRMDPMWMFSTYLANTVGRFLTKLPFGDRMLGMNFYTALTVCVLAVCCYCFYTKKIGIPEPIVFVGEMIAIGLCWCPTALLYNYLTYLLMLAGVLCLYQGLTKDKFIWFMAAGVCLGVNIFVRFSNLSQMAFIVAVWAYAVLKKREIKRTFVWTGWCVCGYVLGIVVVGGYISLRYGAAEYISSIERLLTMPKEATSYTISSMIISQFQNYLQNLIWLGKMLPFVIAGVAGFAILPSKFRIVKKAGFLCGMILVYYWLMNQNMFNMKYSTKLSVFQWAVSLLTFIMISGICTVFGRKESAEVKLLCMFAMIIAVVTPLGSNNHLYSSINNLFFGAPVVLWILWKRLKTLPLQRVVKAGKRQIVLSFWPVKAAVALVIVMLTVQSVGFGFGYVFSETDGGENLHTKLVKSDILKGMYTDEMRAQQLQTLLAYVQDNGLKGKEILLYGNIPALSYYLEMPFVISPWPELSSYNYEVMCDDLERVRSRIREGNDAPVLLLEAGYGKCLTESVLGETDQTILQTDKKLALLMDFAGEFEYQLKFSNDKFLLFESAKR